MINPDQMCFGLTDELDRQSFACFLQLAGRKEFAQILSERISRDEIIQHVDAFTGLLREHLSEDEYHRLFLQDKNHNHS